MDSAGGGPGSGRVVCRAACASSLALDVATECGRSPCQTAINLYDVVIRDGMLRARDGISARPS
jgi:hypothetical protein